MPVSSRLHFLAAGSDLGVHVDGSARGPRRIVQTLGIEDQTTFLDAPLIAKSHAVTDRAKNRHALQEFNHRLYKTAVAINKEKFVITLGGDHAVAIASSLASLHARPGSGIIWFDAHTDFHRLDTTITGNLHGLPLAVLTGVEPALNDLCPGSFYDPARAVIVGARSVDAPEWENLRAAGVTVLGSGDIKKRGIVAVLDEALQIAAAGAGIHFSFDLDVIDPRLAPGVSVPEADGLDFAEVQMAAAWLHAHAADFSGFDLVEYNPVRDRADKTLSLAVYLLRQIFAL